MSQARPKSKAKAVVLPSPSEQLREMIRATGLGPRELSRAVAESEGEGSTGLDPGVIRRFLAGQRGLTTESIDRLGPVLGLQLGRAMIAVGGRKG